MPTHNWVYLPDKDLHIYSLALFFSCLQNTKPSPSFKKTWMLLPKSPHSPQRLAQQSHTFPQRQRLPSNSSLANPPTRPTLSQTSKRECFGQVGDLSALMLLLMLMGMGMGMGNWEGLSVEDVCQG